MAVHISPAERLILFMLAELYEATGVDGEIDPAFIKAAVGGGHSWGLAWRYDGLLGEDISEEVASETAKIMTMWRFIDNSLEALPKADRERLIDENHLRTEAPRFEGFDANEGSGHFGACHFLVIHLGRFEELRGRPLNSHSAGSLPKYRRMHAVFDEALSTSRALKGTLDLADLEAVLKA